ncbi:MAG: hypothetical protein HY901_21895 [Deltaproteobacteria bacterium]|nr:hypothetical protein [Deltaproteobacteria bacterium]
MKSRSRVARALIAVLALPGLAAAQTYTTSIQETGPLSTTYTKRYNWRDWSDLRHTTMKCSPSVPNACEESPCLDDGEPGDRCPDSTRGGTATSTVPNIQPGKYKLELRFRESANRATSVPWKVSDGANQVLASGTVDQHGAASEAVNWVVLGNSDTSPIEVGTSAILEFGSATKTFNGSLSYGGFRLTRVAASSGPDAGTLPRPDAGGGAPACSELASREFDDPATEVRLSLGSPTLFSFHIDGVPAPSGLVSAKLTMRLYDADYPGQEGTVYVNGHGPFSLPADPSWSDTSADAVLDIPVSSVQAGTNLIQFGAGSRSTTYYTVSRVALTVDGPACASSGPDASLPGPDASPLMPPDAAVEIQPDASEEPAQADAFLPDPADSGSEHVDGSIEAGLDAGPRDGGEPDPTLPLDEVVTGGCQCAALAPGVGDAAGCWSLALFGLLLAARRRPPRPQA